MSDAERADLTAEIAAALDRLPVVLADDQARSRLLAVAAQLPAALRSGPLGLEIRMAGPRVIDFFAAATPGDTSYEALLAALRSPGWSDARKALDLAEVLLRWTRSEGSLPAVARYLLIEADSPEVGQPVAVPSIFLSPRGAHDRWRPGMKPNAFQGRLQATTMAAAELSGVWPDPGTAAALADVAAALPQTADIFAVGAMLSRDAGASMRVAVRRLTPDQTHDLLCVVGRPQQADVLAAWAARTVAKRQAVAFEIGPGAEPRVGLELSPDTDWKQASLLEWPQLLAEVVEAGVAEADRAAAVPGLVDADGDPLWGLAHVKIAADDHGLLPVSKLYVGLLYGSAT